jgi:thiol:disulfide interchange protein DsbA|tara:strand:- start:604 stop:1200 length:597 start_codon:yes stop_codon:yes gene_type:complete
MNNSILSQLAKLAFLLFAAGSIFAQPQAGRDYERIPEGLITEPGITEVFGYWCPACYGFEQTVLEMKKRRPDIIINQIPAGGEMLARLYYTIQALGLGDEGHMNVYKYYQIDRKPIRSSRDIQSFARKYGYDEEKFMTMYSSFSVGIKAKNATRLVNNLGNSGVFSGVPTVVINGKYKLNRTRDTELNIQNMFYLYDR